MCLILIGVKSLKLVSEFDSFTVVYTGTSLIYCVLLINKLPNFSNNVSIPCPVLLDTSINGHSFSSANSLAWSMET